MQRPQFVLVSDASCIGEVRRGAARKSVDAGLNETEQGRVAVIATELAANLVKHAQNGKALVQVVETPAGKAVELISIDSGPGISDLPKAFQDGFSTAGTAGNGLGAVRRLSSEFDIYSSRPGGTVLVARVERESSVTVSAQSSQQANPDSTKMELNWGGIAMCAPGELECGDNWGLFGARGQLFIVVADGLGHGAGAALAANKALDAFNANPTAAPGVYLKKAHQELSGTRGAAIAAANLELSQGVVNYAGIGNISGTLISDAGRQGLVTHNGIVGVQMRAVQQFQYSVSSSGVLIMHSDGLQTRWNLDDYPGLMRQHPSVIAGVLFRDFVRGRDDATVVVARWNAV